MTQSNLDLGLFQHIRHLVQQAQNQTLQIVNQAMSQTYFEIGKAIVQNEQQGKHRAEYGKQQLAQLSQQLTAEFGKGFSIQNLRNMRQFYLVYSEHRQAIANLPIQQTASSEFKLSYSHYLKLMRIADPIERQFYETESIKNHWSLRELERQFDTALFTRLALSKNQQEILDLAIQGQTISEPKDLIKDPYILEFLGLSEHSHYSENELEQRLIDKLEHFLLELGAGFTFVGRQQRLTFDEQHFYVDLVFYNRLLRCFVLIDLKIGKLKHQDIGQMQMYVNYYDRQIKLDDENKTIGIILCQDKSQSVVEFTLPEDNTQIFASRYQTILPSKEQLIKLIDE